MINASAKSAGDAKVIATNNARRNALVILLGRISFPASAANNVTDEEIFDMVRSEQIAEEKIAGNNYSATFNIMFAKSAVERILKVKKDDTQQDSYLLIPIKITKTASEKNSTKLLLWEDQNEWRSAVDKVLKAKFLTKFILPENDASNSSIINGDNAEDAGYSQIEPLLARYKVANAYLVFFYFDDIENKVSVTVRTITKLQKKQVKLGFVNVDRLSYESLLGKVSDKTIEYLINSQKEAASKTISTLKFEVKISSFGNWLMMKNKIENSNLISQMNIDSISKDYVRITVNYSGADSDVIAAFAKYGLALNKTSDDGYVVTLASTLSNKVSDNNLND